MAAAEHLRSPSRSDYRPGGRPVQMPLIGALLLSLALAAPTPARSAELVVYSARKDALMAPVIEAFQKDTGIKVTLKTGGGGALANQLIEEKSNPRADVFVTIYAPGLNRLAVEGVLLPYTSPATLKIPPEFRASDGSWTGVSGRMRVIMYNSTLVKPEQLPKSVLELTDPRWKGKIASAGIANDSMQAHVAALVKLIGEARTVEWLRGLVANDARFFKGHTEVRKGVGRGEFHLGLVNDYYFYLEKEEGSPVAVVYPDQGPSDIGVVMTMTGVTIIRGTKNPEAAQRFVDSLMTPKAQQLFAQTNFEIPLLPGTKPARGVRSLDTLRLAKYPHNLVTGAELDAAIKLMARAGVK